MKISVPKESFPLEKRVMILPDAAKTLVDAGHEVYVEKDIAVEIGFSNEDYKESGVEIVNRTSSLIGLADLVIKLKMPVPHEFSQMKKDSILFCMMHSEQNPQNIYYCGLQEIVAVEMEKIVDDTTMRLIDQTYETGEAGVLYALTHSNKFPEDMYAVILGYGGVARGAIATCEKLGMKVSIIRRTHHEVLPNFVKKADILINALAWPQTFRDGKYHLVRREDIQNAKENLVVLDLAVDIPGPIETVTHHTTYENPFYYEEDRTHIAIYGYPGLFPLSSSVKYSKQVLPIALTIANNNGLAEIHKIEELGPYIHNAILDPKAYHWEDYKPVGYNDIVALE